MKRTRLKPGKPPQRRKPLPRSTLPRDRKPLRPVSAKRKAATPALAAARKTVRERAGGWCELRTPVCIQVGSSAHHRAGRDGDRLTDPDLMAWTCEPCHAHAHAHPTLAYEHGWMICRTTRRAS